jgi:hypothetical protein
VNNYDVHLKCRHYLFYYTETASLLFRLINANISVNEQSEWFHWAHRFEHLKVNHSLNCVDPDSGAHANTIESTWRVLKKFLPKYGTVKSLYDTYF